MPTFHGDITQGKFIKAHNACSCYRGCCPAVIVLPKYDARLPEHLVSPFPVEVVIDAVHLPPVVDEESAGIVLLYVEQAGHHGQFLLLCSGKTFSCNGLRQQAEK